MAHTHHLLKLKTRLRLNPSLTLSMKYLINWKDKQYNDDMQIQVEIVVKHNFNGLKFTFYKCEEKVGDQESKRKNQSVIYKRGKQTDT
jgi:hypothetical protein